MEDSGWLFKMAILNLKVLRGTVEKLAFKTYPRPKLWRRKVTDFFWQNQVIFAEITGKRNDYSDNLCPYPVLRRSLSWIKTIIKPYGPVWFSKDWHQQRLFPVGVPGTLATIATLSPPRKGNNESTTPHNPHACYELFVGTGKSSTLGASKEQIGVNDGTEFMQNVVLKS